MYKGKGDALRLVMGKSKDKDFMEKFAEARRASTQVDVPQNVSSQMREAMTSRAKKKRMDRMEREYERRLRRNERLGAPIPYVGHGET